MSKKIVHTPRQIVDMIKSQTKPRIWSKDLRDWYVAEIVDLVAYNRQKESEKLPKIGMDWRSSKIRL